MAEVAAKSAKTQKGATEKKNPVSSKSTPELSQSVDSPVEQVLNLQHTIGNRAVTRLIQSGVLQAKLNIGAPDDKYEQEAERVAEQVTVMPKLMDNHRLQRQLNDEAEEERGTSLESRIKNAAGGGTELSHDTRSNFEGKFGADFNNVRIHDDMEARDLSQALGAKAFTHGNDIYFNKGQFNPGSAEGKRLLAHELTHTIQQGAASEKSNYQAVSTRKLPPIDPGNSGSRNAIQAVPNVTNINVPTEIGVAKSINAAAVLAGRGRIDWNLIGAPATVTVNSTGRVRAKISAKAGALASAGGTFKVQAKLHGNPADDFISPPITIVGVTSMTFAPNPPFANQPMSAGMAAFPPNTADPNRDGYGGNTAVVAVVTAPAARATTLSLRPGGARIGASVGANVVTPGSRTGFIEVRASDNATRTFLDKKLTVNPVPTRLKSFGAQLPLAPAAYGAQNVMNFQSSDTTANPLDRVVGETITFQRDDFQLLGGINPPIGPNPAPVPGLSAQANAAADTNRTPIMGPATIPRSAVPGVVPGQNALDVNNYVGPGVTVGLPRFLIARQGLHHRSWMGTQSKEFDKGVHRRSLRAQGGGFIFRTEQIFPAAQAAVVNDAYAGPPLIKLTGLAITPKVPAAQGIADDGVATGQATINTNVPARNVNWLVLRGPIAFTTPPLGTAIGVGAKAIIQAGMVAGSFPIQVQDSIFYNRQQQGNVLIKRVELQNMSAAPANVPAGTLASIVTVNADPGGRNLLFTVDPVSAAAGVTVAPIAVAGPAAALPPRSATVTRPAAFRGTVTVTARDQILRGRQDAVQVVFQ